MPDSSDIPILTLPSSEQAVANGSVTVAGVGYADSFAAQNPGLLYLGISDGTGSLYGFYPQDGASVPAGGSGSNSIVFIGTDADVQAILNSLTYVAAGVAGSDAIRFDVWNQAGVETTGIVPVAIAADPPPQAFVWTGAVSSDWNTGGNWSGGVAPGSGDAVTIAGGTPYAPALADATLGGETITLAGGSLSLTDVLLNATLQGSGTVDVGGTLTIGSSGVVDASRISIAGTAETIVNNGSLLAPGGTLDLTNAWGAADGAATLINNGSLSAQVLGLTAASRLPDGTPVPFAGGPDWTLVNAGTVTIPDGGSFDLNGTVQGGLIAFAGAGTLTLEQGMAFADGASVGGFGGGDQIRLLDPQSGNDQGVLGYAGGALEIVAGGTVVQAIPMTGGAGLGNFVMQNESSPSGFGTIVYVPAGATDAAIVAPVSASVAQGGTLVLNGVAIDPASPAALWPSIVVSAGSGTLFLDGASGSGSQQVSLSGLTGQQADAALASLRYVPAAGSSADTVSITAFASSPADETRSIPITITPADPPGVAIAASDAYPLELVSNSVITAASGNHMIFIGGTGDTLTATGGTETVQAFQGHNTITTSGGNDTISFAGSGNVIDAGGGSNVLEDSGSGSTIVMPGAGQGMDDIFGYVLQNGDVLDFRAALAATQWDGSAATLGAYLQVGAAGNDAIISLSTTAGGAAVQIADLRDSGPVGLAGVLAHALT